MKFAVSTKNCARAPMADLPQGGSSAISRREDEVLEEQRTRLQQKSSLSRYAIEEYDAGENDWSVSYTDMVTLLMIFFAVLSSFNIRNNNPPPSGADTSITQVAPKTPKTVFDGQGTTVADFGVPANLDNTVSQYDDPEAVTGTTHAAPTGEGEGGPKDATKPAEPPKPAENKENKELADKLQALVQKDQLAGQVQVISAGDTVTLRISDKILFASGRAGLEASGLALVGKLSSVLKEAGGDISIEGHTDSVPISTPQFPSNWELSSARAATVLRQFMVLGLPATKMRAIGYADTKPVASEISEEAKAKNRRVEIVISSRAP